jgi:hypothetical protein
MAVRGGLDRLAVSAFGLDDYDTSVVTTAMAAEAGVV